MAQNYLTSYMDAPLLLHGIFCNFKSHQGRKASCRCMGSATLWSQGMGAESCSLKHFCLTHDFYFVEGDWLDIQLFNLAQLRAIGETRSKKLIFTDFELYCHDINAIILFPWLKKENPFHGVNIFHLIWRSHQKICQCSWAMKLIFGSILNLECNWMAL